MKNKRIQLLIVSIRQQSRRPFTTSRVYRKTKSLNVYASTLLFRSSMIHPPVRSMYMILSYFCTDNKKKTACGIAQLFRNRFFFFFPLSLSLARCLSISISSSIYDLTHLLNRKYKIHRLYSYSFNKRKTRRKRIIYG